MRQRMQIRPRRPDLAGASLALLALGACVPRAAPPAPLPAPAPAPRPVPPPPAPVPPPVDWDIAPLSPGDWHYSAAGGPPSATFGSERMGLLVACPQRGTISFAALGTFGHALVIRTSFGVRRLAVETGHLATTGIELPASDPLFDQMAFSRGRFLVTVEGGGSLVVPAWPEFARVVEECRGQ